MAEERNLGVARASESDDLDSTKAELQRRMEEARESITQTVTEIKDTVTNQYHAVKDTVTEALDWREQFRKRPVAFSIGALSAGFIVGYGFAAALKGDGYDEEEDYPSYEESDAFSTTGATPVKVASASPYAERGLASPASYAAPQRAAHAAASGAYGSTASASAAHVEEDDSGASEEEPDKPGLIERFKETRAYDKLQEEIGSLGDRFIEELSNVGQTVVLPLLFNKIKDLFGVDLSRKESGQQRGGSGGGTQSARSAGAASASGQTGAASSYATSENRGSQ